MLDAEVGAWDGTLHLANGVTLDLNGHNLTVSNIVIPDYEDVPGYKFVDFLQTTSSGKQWINTEYTPACSDRVETKIRYMPIGDSFQSLFCTRGPSHAGTFTAFVKGTGIRVDYADGSGGSTPSIPFTTALAYEIVVNGNTGKAYVNDREFTISTSEYTPAGPFSLLGAHNAGANLSTNTTVSYTTTCQLYYFRVYDKDGNLQCDLVPAIRTSDSAVGMYDRQRAMFVVGNGAAAFVTCGRATTAKIDNTSDTVSELHVNVPSGSFRNVDVPIMGNIRFVKEGAGTFVPRKEGQTYCGGTIVSNGLVKVTNSGAAAPLGQGVLYEVLDFIQSSGKQWIYTDYTPASTDTVEMDLQFTTLPSGSTWMGLFCSRGSGSSDPYFCVMQAKTFRVDHWGGTTMPSGMSYSRSYTWNTGRHVVSVIGNTAECKIDGNTIFTGNTASYTPQGPFSILGGHTFTIISEDSKYLYLKNLTVTEGTVVFPEHLWFDIASAGGGVNATNTTFDVTALMRQYGVLSVGNYVVRRDASTNARDPSKIQVYNTLAPVGAFDYFSCTLMDGSTIDFSQATGSLKAATTGGIQFADNATVTIKLGDSHLSNPIVAWTTAPENINTVTFVRDASESGYKLEVHSDGLYVTKKGLMLIVK